MNKSENGRKRSENKENKATVTKEGDLPPTVGQTTTRGRSKGHKDHATRSLLQMFDNSVYAPKEKGELVTFDREIEHSLRSARRALQFGMAKNNTNIAVEKMEEG
ncbi:hypothetical protein M9H77_07498 [Catharanthus roseus]|uniref:Uncharacterized protein n=1 Tax=Catharanthus roseus TaxID=4058 RepID=A0ACC0BVD7_CATRO|nr:hypothetical protein M9H77_07498 [Catharanthus roseus]